MFSTASLIEFFATSVVLIAIPGPSVMFIVGRTLAEGRKAGLLTVVFNALGHTTWMLAVAFGLGELLTVYPVALEAIKIAGGVYLGYIGVQTIRSRNDKKLELASGNHSSFKRIAKDGFIVGFSNPKVAVFFMAVLPQFLNPAENFTIQFLILGFIFELMGTAGDTIYALAAGAARNWIFNKTQRLVAITATGGTLIVLLAVTLLATSVLEALA